MSLKARPNCCRLRAKSRLLPERDRELGAASHSALQRWAQARPYSTSTGKKARRLQRRSRDKVPSHTRFAETFDRVRIAKEPCRRPSRNSEKLTFSAITQASRFAKVSTRYRKKSGIGRSTSP